MQWRNWKNSLLAFAIGQPMEQAINIVTGFFLLRWLNKDEYAMFGVVFAFQSTVTQLTDLGFAGSIVALAGERASEPSWLGRYLRSARYYRAKIIAFSLTGAALVFPFLTWNQPWGWVTKLFLLKAVILAVVFQGWIIYGSPLLVHRRLAAYYQPRVLSATLRLLIALVMFATGCLSGLMASMLSALQIAFIGLCYRRAAADCVVEPVLSDQAANHAMRRYLAPMMPSVVFTAFQSQITVAIITMFGTTEKIAEVVALGRIGQLFALLSAFNTVLLEPYFARLPASLFQCRYWQVLVSAVVLAALISLGGFLFPEPLIWLLGSTYGALSDEIGWVVLTACVAYISGVMWTMHSARRWVWWWGSVMYIVILIFVQVCSALFLNLGETMSVLWFGLISALAVLLVHITTGVYGFIKQKN